MKNKLLVIALALFLPLMCWGKVNVKYAYKNKVLKVTITNETDKEIMLFNETHQYDSNSYLYMQLLDSKDTVLTRDRYSFGDMRFALFKPKSKKTFSYSVKNTGVDFDKLKKIKLELWIKYLVLGEETHIYREEKVLTVK